MEVNEDEIEKKGKWFSNYIDKIENAAHQNHKKYLDYFICPCCNYPTLTERGGYDICRLCFWEDDGQDDSCADEVWGGPNSDYSLTEARENFKKHFIMFRSTDDKFHIQADKIELKKKIILQYQELFKLKDNEKEKKWSEIKKNLHLL